MNEIFLVVALLWMPNDIQVNNDLMVFGPFNGMAACEEAASNLDLVESNVEFRIGSDRLIGIVGTKCLTEDELFEE